MPVTIDCASEYTESESGDGDIEAVEVVNGDVRLSVEPRVELPTPGLAEDSVGQQGDPDLQGSAGAVEDGKLVVSDEVVELGRGQRTKTPSVLNQSPIKRQCDMLSGEKQCRRRSPHWKPMVHGVW
ncbi:hypothetical protein LIER_42021 [Lithospermum erythrorhizon]|uniref:Uncharacterized protein n=1 Tax=Lithospermum erythrorhizon TaxID=34254 RepID=A0AAV3RJS7_LITER